MDLSSEPLRFLLNAQGSQTGSNSVVLQRHRRAEHRHDPVARELTHLLQNRESGGSSVPHDPHNSPAAVTAPRPSPAPSTSVSCHRWSAVSVISPCHLRDEVSRPSYVVYFATRWAALRTD